MNKLLPIAAVCTFGLMLSTASAQDFSPYMAPAGGVRSTIPGQDGMNSLNGCFPRGSTPSICGPDGCYAPGSGSSFPVPQANGTSLFPFSSNVNSFQQQRFPSLQQDLLPFNTNNNRNQRDNRFLGSMIGNRPARDRFEQPQDRYRREQASPEYHLNPGQFQIQPFPLPNPMLTSTPATNPHQLINHSVSPSFNGLTQN